MTSKAKAMLEKVLKAMLQNYVYIEKNACEKGRKMVRLEKYLIQKLAIMYV